MIIIYRVFYIIIKNVAHLEYCKGEFDSFAPWHGIIQSHGTLTGRIRIGQAAALSSSNNGREAYQFHRNKELLPKKKPCFFLTAGELAVEK